MTYNYDDGDEMDQEVADDLRLRSSTMRDPERGAPTLIGSDLTDVALWPCRTKCGAMVPVNETTLEVWRVFNKQLRTRGSWSNGSQQYRGPEDPLDASEIVYCQACISAIKTHEGDECRKYVDRMAEVIRELKQAVAEGDALKEREMTKKLQGRHPDINGLLAALRERKAERKTGKSKP